MSKMILCTDENFGIGCNNSIRGTVQQTLPISKKKQRDAL
ncbi:UNVERIFIED_ORG: hypothetical protein [Escherichia phage CMSTMSU]